MVAVVVESRKAKKKREGKIILFYFTNVCVEQKQPPCIDSQTAMAPKNHARNKPNNKSMEERMKILERAIANIEQKIQSVRLEQGSSRSNARPVGSFSRGRFTIVPAAPARTNRSRTNQPQRRTRPFTVVSAPARTNQPQRTRRPFRVVSAPAPPAHTNRSRRTGRKVSFQFQNNRAQPTRRGKHNPRTVKQKQQNAYNRQRRAAMAAAGGWAASSST